jgi:predicted phage-related endonuclease
VPDRTLKTISATEAPALFNASPYVTRWMLWQRFANGMDIDSRADARMNWGRKLQPLILEQVAEEMRLEVRPNNEDAYMRRGLLGCTRDATIICPDRGPGAVETKCVFDYRTWMADWNGGKQPPRHHEIQLQQQMLVGDEGGESYRWGLLVAWVAGELHYFERAPVKDLWAPLYQEAERFFADVQAKREPEPFGAPVELPLLAQLFPTDQGQHD